MCNCILGTSTYFDQYSVWAGRGGRMSKWEGEPSVLWSWVPVLGGVSMSLRTIGYSSWSTHMAEARVETLGARLNLELVGSDGALAISIGLHSFLDWYALLPDGSVVRRRCSMRLACAPTSWSSALLAGGWPAIAGPADGETALPRSSRRSSSRYKSWKVRIISSEAVPMLSFFVLFSALLSFLSPFHLSCYFFLI